jgi:hypothetical protein
VLMQLFCKMHFSCCSKCNVDVYAVLDAPTVNSAMR